MWLHSAARVARAMNPYLAPEDAGAVWQQIISRSCFAGLQEFQRRWLLLFRAVAARDAPRMAQHAAALLATQAELGAEAREYLLLAAMAGHIATGDRPAALALWHAHKARIRSAGSPALRLLRCHADLSDCAADFKAPVSGLFP